MSDMKFCRVCGTEKPLGEFYRSKMSKDGRDSRCRECERERPRERDQGRLQSRTEDQMLADYRRIHPSGLKRCRSCRVEKPRSDYGIDRSKSDAMRQLCNECATAKRFPKELMDRWEDQDTWNCVYCGKPFEEVEHVLPRALGGTDDPRNLVPSCADCNRGPGGKHDMDPVTWMETKFPELLRLPVVFQITL